MADANAVPADPLLSWNDGAVKRSIQAFVQAVTDPHSADFVPRAARIAVFDNDGTLWNEQPLYIQLAFALDRVKALAPEHPEWYTTQPFQAVLEHDQSRAGLEASGKRLGTSRGLKALSRARGTSPSGSSGNEPPGSARVFSVQPALRMPSRMHQNARPASAAARRALSRCALDYRKWLRHTKNEFKYP